MAMRIPNITNYKPKEFAALLNVTVKTLQRWDREKILVANRTPTNRRYYTYDQYLQFKGIEKDTDSRKIVLYARVSSRKQADDLENQVDFLQQYANAKGLIVDTIARDYGSGLNYNRKKWNQLLDAVMENQVRIILESHRDRFVRFGFDWFERFCKKFNVEIVVVKNEKLSPQGELVQDIVNILHVFSDRLHGLRKYKKQIEGDEELAEGIQDRAPSHRTAEG